MTEIILASHNKNKAKEMQNLLIHLPVKLLTLADIGFLAEIEEDGETFAENALIKARAVWQYRNSWVMADDSGLEVPFLGGRPGVHSARYAGYPTDDQANNDKLVEELKEASTDERQGIFVSEIALISPEGRAQTFRGECKGLIVLQPQGKGGFGYDPYFFVEELGKTYAELTQEEKNKISHRGVAMRKCLEVINNYFG